MKKIFNFIKRKIHESIERSMAEGIQNAKNAVRGIF